MSSTSRCPRCGGDNRCGIASAEPCWCATQVRGRLPLPAPGSTCYCRSCLAALLAQATSSPDASAPAAPEPRTGG